MRKHYLNFICLLAAVFGYGLPPEVAVSQPHNLTKVTLVLTSDDYKMGEENGRGGLPRIAAVMKREKSAHANVLTVHAGDTISPSLMSGFDQGAHIVDLFNMAPLDVFVPGNHEFDFGPDVFLKRMGAFRAQVLAANLKDAQNLEIPGIAASRMFSFGDIRIGVVGVTDEDSRVTSKPGRLRFSSSLDAADREARRLRQQGADLVVLVAHAGRDRDNMLFTSGVADVILSGHDHDLFMRFNEKTAIAEAGEDGMAVVAVDLDVEVSTNAGGVRRVKWWPQFRFIDTKDVEPDVDVAKRVSALERQLDRDLGGTIATTSVDLDSRNAAVRTGEAVIANLFADALRAGTRSDVALLNGGSFRGGRVYTAGSSLSQKDVLSELPFLNKAYVLQVSGADLKAALEQGFAGAENEVGRFPQVSGLKIRADLTRPEGRRVVSVLVHGSPLKLRRNYRLATNDYLAEGGDGYFALKRAKVIVGASDAALVSSLVIEHLRAKRVVAPKFEGRVIVARSQPPR